MSTAIADDLLDLQAQVRSMSEAIAARDPDRVASFYLEDAVFLTPSAPARRGRSAIRDSWAALLRDPDVALTFQPVRIDLASSGDYAMELAEFENAGRAGRYLLTWKRDGAEWRIATDAPRA